MESNQTTTPKSSNLALASLVLSCISLILGVIGIATAISGVICGHIAMNKLKTNQLTTGKGKAKVGIIVGYSYIGFHALLFFGAMVLVTFNVMTKPDPIFPTPETQNQELSIEISE